MKTVVEEQEVQSVVQPISREQKNRTQAVSEVRVHQKPRPEIADAQSKTECFESCLDISALFLPRG